MVSIGSRIWMFGVAGQEACLGYEASRVYLCYVARSPTRKEERRRKNWNDLDVTVFCLPLVPWIEPPYTSSVACFSRLVAFPVKHATGELSKEKARRQLSLRWNTRRLVDQVRTRECPMSSIRGRIEVSLYTPLLYPNRSTRIVELDESIS